MSNQLTYREKFICEMIWGGVPTDTEYVRNSTLFQEGLTRFDSGEWKYFEKEEWKYIEGFDNKYKVSSHGRVMSKTHISKDWKCLKLTKSTKGYPVAKLYYNGYKSKSINVHRLVAMCFIPNQDNKPFVNHINMDRGDNHKSNLEWVTPRENKSHAAKLNHKKVSKYVGVTWSKKENKWIAMACINNTNVTKRYNTEIEAAKGYDDILEKNGLKNKYKNY